MFVARKVAFDQRAGNIRRRKTHVPQNQLQRLCSAMTVVKEKQGCTHSLLLVEIGGQHRQHPPTACKLVGFS